MRIIPLILVLAGCTSLDSIVEACHNQGGHAVVVVNPAVTEIRGVRCEYQY
ncbi:hypothetical protein [Litorivivens sp.]|uniref:hypothetical protein n=1 Tax=Litorivivens sp. TaxID=2020868 RepID=UPI003561B24E